MAGSVNKVIVLGNLGAKPDLKYLPSGQAVCEMRIATTETYTDRQEQKQERTEWHRVVVWGKTAENCAKYLDKGRQVYVEGRLQTRSWDDKEGKKQYMTETVANQVVFLGGGQRDGGGQSQGGGSASAAGYGGGPPAPAAGGFGYGSGGDDTGGEDDIPF
jgi:single-strand DNA-binding protein